MLVKVKRESRVSGIATYPDAVTLPSTITMSYHNRDREWDRGKDSWQQDDYSAWDDGPRGNSRGRDDDYYTEGKRRKYNNGVRLSAKSLSPLGLNLSLPGLRRTEGVRRL